MTVQNDPDVDGAAFTPGPWAYRHDEHDDWGIVRAAQGGGGHAPIICQARDPYCLDSDELNIHRANKTDPWAANACLIAAAPELLAALTAARNTLAGCGMPSIAARICDAAIAKALGA
jgi:hypothetical protein